VELNDEGAVYTASYDAYQSCVDALYTEAHFPQREGNVTAMLLVGTPYENIEATTERLIRLSSIVGAVNLVQYQYSRSTTDGEIINSIWQQNGTNYELQELNCKFYPVARSTQVPFEHYVELTRLATLLNSKYRSKTFDFLGNGLIGQAIRDSLRTESWNPFRQADAATYAEVIPLMAGNNTRNAQK
jgi:hypothetical protein